MSQLDFKSFRTPRRALGEKGLVLVLVVLGTCGIGAGAVMGDWRISLGLKLFGVTLLVFALLKTGKQALIIQRRKTLRQAVIKVVGPDMTPTILADGNGEIMSRNGAARGDPDGAEPTSLAQALTEYFANPVAVLFRLQSRAQATGSAREDIVTRRGHVRVSVQLVDSDAYLWRIEDIAERPVNRHDNTGLPMLTSGPTGTVLFMNEAFRRLVGSRAKSLDRVFKELPLVSGRIHSVETADGPVQCMVAAVPGIGGRQEIYLLPGHHGGVVQPTAASWDSIEELPVPLLKIAGTGEVLASNREARQLLGTGIEDGTRLSDLLEGLGRPIIDWLVEVMSGKAIGARQFLRGKGEKQDFFVQVSLHTADGPEGKYLIAVLNDMTEFKSLERQFVQSQKMQAIGQLAGGVAHDFNNLLTAISGHCDLLLLRHDQGDPDYSDLIQIHQNANRAASFVGQLLAFSRKQTLSPEVLDLRDTLADLTHLLNRLVGEKVRLTLNHDPALRSIWADKRQLEQVLMNLVVNARDAMPGGGEVRIETSNLTLRAPIERDRAKVAAGDYVLLRVIDEGHGIPPEKINKIFEPFYTTKRVGEGTGLGLSTAYGIVKQTGGFIFADSEVGIGSVFSVYIPRHEVRTPQGAIAQATAALPKSDPAVRISYEQGDGVVLLVEDEAPVRAFASRALRLRGYTVLEADSAETALVMLQDPDLRVDLFLTDVIMPGKDGPTWVREALKARPNTKVVFVSGYAEDAFGEQQAAIPNSIFLPKPFSLNDLTLTVQRQLH